MSVSVAAAEANERCHKVEQKFVTLGGQDFVHLKSCTAYPSSTLMRNLLMDRQKQC